MVSVVAYDDAVSLISPATDLTDRDRVKAAIDRIQAGGSTALFSGISKGAEELRRNKRPNQVNRVVLLSDGMANVGPPHPRILVDWVHLWPRRASPSPRWGWGWATMRT